MSETLLNAAETANTHKKGPYTFEETLVAATKYFKGDELAAKVWVNKYSLKSADNEYLELTPDDMHRRISRELSRIEEKYENPVPEETIFNLLKDFKYIIPQGGPMSGIGNNHQIVSLSNCFVIGHEASADSYGAIMKVDEEQVQLMKRRGGVGHDLSHVRPKGSPVNNSALTSTGIVPFMERYSNSTREVAQDGRRGALMLSISIRHPDSEAFIDAKLTEGKITGANVSVRIDDEFMQAVMDDTDYEQRFPVDSKYPTYKKVVKARTIWDKIVQNAWKSAEPGILFWDTIIREAIPDCYADLGFQTVSTNPCGEIPLCPYDSCRLLAINLYSYVENPFTENSAFNFEKFEHHVALAQRFMDDIIDLEIEKIDHILMKIGHDPEERETKRVERLLWEKIRDKALKGRRTGLGTTAEGDMLAALGLRYGTDEAIQFSERIHKTVALSAYHSSVILAKERGEFVIFDAEREKNNPFIRRLFEADPSLENEMQLYGRRNISLLTIAPTGTTSLMTQTSSGIEPVFLPYYRRRRKVNANDPVSRIDFVDESGDSWEEFSVFHHHFTTWLQQKGYNVEEVKAYPPEKMEELVKLSPYYKATSQDVDWVKKVEMQGRIQKWVDHSISVTINMPEDVTSDLVDKLYREAWKWGCKGTTVYRDGSRSGVLISNDKKEENTTGPFPRKRPRELQADVVRFYNNSEKWIAFVGLIDDRPYEIFTGRVDEDVLFIPKNINQGIIIKSREKDGKARYDFSYIDKDGYRATFEGLSRMFEVEFWNYAKLISGILRHGMPILEVVNLISTLHLDSESINSWKMGVERALKKYIPDGTPAKEGIKCPTCEAEGGLIYKEGCLTCMHCGYSKCG